MDVVALAKLQFAFTVAYHFLFVPLSIGLGLVVVLFERRYYKSGKPEDQAASELWIKIFAATFAIGVATGITMEFAFGTNWATYSRFVGDIFGAPLAAEALFAFFLESTFLGVLLFGRGQGLEEVLLRLHVARLARLDALGAVDHHRQLVDADSGRLQDRRDRVRPQGRADELLRGRASTRRRCRATSTRSNSAAHHRRLRGGRDRRLLPAQGRLQGLRPRGDLDRSDDRRDLLGAHARSPATSRRSRSSRTSRPRSRRWRVTGTTGPMPLGVVGWVDVANKTHHRPRDSRRRRASWRRGSFTTPYPGPERLHGRGPAADSGRPTRRITG